MYDADHEGHNCPRDMHKPNHNPFITRANVHILPGASFCGVHKTILPGHLGHLTQHTWLPGAAEHKHVKSNNDMIQSIHADLHPKSNSSAQINKLVDTYDSKSDDDDKTLVHSNCTNKVCNRTMNKELQTSNDCGIFDSGTTGHFLTPNAPINNNQSTKNQLCITVTDGHSIASTHTCLLDIPLLCQLVLTLVS